MSNHDLQELQQVQNDIEGNLGAYGDDEIVPGEVIEDFERPPFEERDAVDDFDDEVNAQIDQAAPETAPVPPWEPATWQVQNNGAGQAAAVIRVPLANGRVLVATGRGRRSGDALKEAAGLVEQAAKNKMLRAVMPPQALLASIAVGKMAELARKGKLQKVVKTIQASSAYKKLASIFS